MIFLPEEVWVAKVEQHASLVGAYTEAYLKRRSLGLKHPVLDFLFTYYSFSPTKLKQWIPSFNESLEITPQTLVKYSWLDNFWFQQKEAKLFLDLSKIPKTTLKSAKFIADLCRNILLRPPRFGCFGSKS